MGVNCFNVFSPEGKRPAFVLLSIDGTSVQGLEVDGEGMHTVSVTVDLEDIDPATLEVTHFYGLDEVRYESIRHVALGVLVKWPYVWLRSLRLTRVVRQRWFNLWPLKVGVRLHVLRDVVSASEDGSDGVSALEVMTHRHGNWWVDHPSWREYQRRLDAQLQLLADAGDLTTHDNYTYRPTGQGVRTLDERQDAARKHGANWWVQVALGAIALAAAVFTAAQAGFLRLPTVLDLQGKKDERADKAATTPSNAPTGTDAAGPTAASTAASASLQTSMTQSSSVAASGPSKPIR